MAQLEAARTPRTKALLFVSPSNPTGAVYPRAEMEELGRWAAEHGIWVVADEIYEHLVYDGAEHHSMAVVVPDLADMCIVVNGVAKTYAMTGWRVGWMLGPADVIAAASNLQSHTTSNVANVSQRAALAAVSGDLSAVAEMRARSTAAAGPCTGCSTRSTGSSASCPKGRSTPSRRSRASSAARSEVAGRPLEHRARRARHRPGPGGGRARGGVRGARSLPDVVRPRRQGAGRRRLPSGRSLLRCQFTLTTVASR